MSKNKEAVSKNLYYLLLMLIGETKTLDAIKKNFTPSYYLHIDVWGNKSIFWKIDWSVGGYFIAVDL